MKRGGVVESIDVVTRPGKKVGRGYKITKEGEFPLLYLAYFSVSGLLLWLGLVGVFDLGFYGLGS